jgi:lantibiotic modifying enzyme
MDVLQSDGLTDRVTALGPSLYGGNSGIALFLIELYEHTREAVFAELAHAALRCSLQQVEGVRPTILSNFSGIVGVALVLQRYQDSAASELQPIDAERIVSSIESSSCEFPPLDAVGGIAGAIPALLFLADAWQNHKLFHLAVTCGERIVREAKWTDKLCIWNPNVMTGTDFKRPLAGLAHGASGIAVAMLELYRATQKSDFLLVARGAFTYEDAVFDRRTNNWRDLRFEDTKGEEDPQPVAWCHGAPGVALARLTARAADPELSPIHEQVALIALGTTVAGIHRNLILSDHDASLCHGTLGLCEVLWISFIEFGLGDPSISIQAALNLVSRYGEQLTWPCGTQTGRLNPSLMLGLAGIGHHLLRLCRPAEVRPVLLTESFGKVGGWHR